MKLKVHTISSCFTGYTNCVGNFNKNMSRALFTEVTAAAAAALAETPTTRRVLAADAVPPPPSKDVSEWRRDEARLSFLVVSCFGLDQVYCLPYAIAIDYFLGSRRDASTWQRRQRRILCFCTDLTPRCNQCGQK